MCTTAQKEEFIRVIDLLPEDRVGRLLGVAYDMAAAVRAEKASSAAKPFASGAVDPSIIGAFPGEAEIADDFFDPITRDELFGILPGKVELADDFFETPECFKEYV